MSVNSICPFKTWTLFESTFEGEQPLDPLHHISEHRHGRGCHRGRGHEDSGLRHQAGRLCQERAGGGRRGDQHHIVTLSEITWVIHNITLQIEIFKGQDNMITMNQTHSKKFHCTYLLHYYPFDTQEHCRLFLYLAVVVTKQWSSDCRFVSWTSSWSCLPGRWWSCSPAPSSCCRPPSWRSTTSRPGPWTIMTKVPRTLNF